MGKFEGVLLASDFDNTLLYTEEALRLGRRLPDLPERNRLALQYFMEQGGHFALATGRALPSIAPLAGRIPMNAPAVICNGASLYDFQKGEYLCTALLDGPVRERFQKLLAAFPNVACEAYHVDNVIHTVQPNTITRNHAHMTHVDLAEVETLMQVPLPLGKLLLEGDHADLERFSACVAQYDWAEEYERIFSGPTLLEVTARGANKGAMVRRLAEILKIAPEHVYCVGDEANDLSMLAISAIPYAPANCAPQVAESGAVVVSHARDGALGDVVADLDRRY